MSARLNHMQVLHSFARVSWASIPRYLRSPFVWGVVVLMLVSTSSAWAWEIKVVDEQGLTRAVRETVENQTVRIVIAGDEHPLRAVLVNVDGIASDVDGVREDLNTIMFRSVSEGTWRIVLTPKREIRSVAINR